MKLEGYLTYFAYAILMYYSVYGFLSHIYGIFKLKCLYELKVGGYINVCNSKFMDISYIMFYTAIIFTFTFMESRKDANARFWIFIPSAVAGIGSFVLPFFF